MNDATNKTPRFQLGDKILVSHNGKRACCGSTAVVTAAHPHTFAATCSCGWKFGGQQTDNYTVIS